MKEIYADYAATSIIYQEVIDIYSDLTTLHNYNPSSSYADMEQGLLEEAKTSIGNNFNIRADQVFFVQNATSANAIILSSLLNKANAHLITERVNHPSISSWIKPLKKMGKRVTLVSNPLGFLNHQELLDSIDENTSHIALTLVNNLTGSILDLKKIVKGIRERENKNIHIHLDASQGIGHVDVDFSLIDSLSLSAHKIGGLKSSGILYLKDYKKFNALSLAGNQQNMVLGGTIDMPGAYSTVAAIGYTLSESEAINKRLKKYKALMLKELDGLYNIYSKDGTSDHILTLASKKYPSQVLLRILYRNNILASAASACSKNDKTSIENQYLELSIKDASKVIRLSFGRLTTLDEIKHIIKVLKENA